MERTWVLAIILELQNQLGDCLSLEFKLSNNKCPCGLSHCKLNLMILLAESILYRYREFALNNRKVSFPGGLVGIESSCNARDLGSVPGLGGSPGGGHSAGEVVLPSSYLFCQMPWLFGDGDRSLGETLQRTVCTGLGVIEASSTDDPRL